jgi:hypothetical protein
MASRREQFRWCAVMLILAFPGYVRSMTLTLQPQLKIAEQYTDNVFNVSGDRSEDFVTSLAPSLRLDYRPGAFSAGGGYTVGPTWYLQHPELNHIDHNGDVYLSIDEQSWSGKIKGRIFITDQPGQVSELNQGIQVPRTHFRQESMGTEFHLRPETRLTSALTYAYVSSQYDSASLTDSVSHSAGLSETYSATRNDELTVSSTLSQVQYESGFTSRQVNGLAMWNHQVSRFTQFHAGTGVAFVQDASPQWLLELQVVREYKAGTLQIGYKRSIGSGGGVVGAATLSQEVNASATRQFLKSLTGTINGRYGSSSGIQGSSDFHLRGWSAGTGLTYEILSWLKGSLNYSHSDQRSTGAGTTPGTIRSNRVIATLTTGLTPWEPFR